AVHGYPKPAVRADGRVIDQSHPLGEKLAMPGDGVFDRHFLQVDHEPPMMVAGIKPDDGMRMFQGPIVKYVPRPSGLLPGTACNRWITHGNICVGLIFFQATERLTHSKT